MITLFILLRDDLANGALARVEHNLHLLRRVMRVHDATLQAALAADSGAAGLLLAQILEGYASSTIPSP